MWQRRSFLGPPRQPAAGPARHLQQPGIHRHQHRRGGADAGGDPDLRDGRRGHTRTVPTGTADARNARWLFKQEVGRWSHLGLQATDGTESVSHVKGQARSCVGCVQRVAGPRARDQRLANGVPLLPEPTDALRVPCPTRRSGRSTDDGRLPQVWQSATAYRHRRTAPQRRSANRGCRGRARAAGTMTRSQRRPAAT